MNPPGIHNRTKILDRNPVATARHGNTQCDEDAPSMRSMQDTGLSDSNSLTATSLAESGLDLGIQRFPLRRLATHRAEPSNLEFLASLLGRIRPFLQSTARELLLAQCRSGLAHDFARLALRQLLLGQAANGLHPLAAEDRSPLPDLLDLLGLHGFHGLHGPM